MVAVEIRSSLLAIFRAVQKQGHDSTSPGLRVVEWFSFQPRALLNPHGH